MDCPLCCLSTLGVSVSSIWVVLTNKELDFTHNGKMTENGEHTRGRHWGRLTTLATEKERNGNEKWRALQGCHWQMQRLKCHAK